MVVHPPGVPLKLSLLSGVNTTRVYTRGNERLDNTAIPTEAQRTCHRSENQPVVNTQQRAAALGLAAGLVHTLVVLFALESLTGGFPTSTARLLLQSLASTLVSLVVIPGLPLYGAWRMDVHESPTRLAAFVGAGAGVAVVVSYPVLTAVSVGAPFGEALGIRLVGPYLVNGISPAVYSGLGALAGFLLGQRNA
jgi:hypothetical protein